jgi:capsular polysaccharide biosynthesis protein
MNVDSVNLIYEATLPTESAYPNVMTVTLLCAAAGLITIIVLISVIFVADDTIRTEEDVHRYLGVTVLAVIPKSQDMAVAAVDKTGRKNIEFRRNES